MASTDFASVGAAVSAGKVTINISTDYGIFKITFGVGRPGVSILRN